MIFPRTFEVFGANELKRMVGHFLFVFGVVGAVTALLPFASTSVLSLKFAMAYAVAWFGAWMALYRVPPTAFTVTWSGVGATIRVLKHST